MGPKYRSKRVIGMKMIDLMVLIRINNIIVQCHHFVCSRQSISSTVWGGVCSLHDNMVNKPTRLDMRLHRTELSYRRAVMHYVVSPWVRIYETKHTFKARSWRVPVSVAFNQTWTSVPDCMLIELSQENTTSTNIR